MPRQPRRAVPPAPLALLLLPHVRLPLIKLQSGLLLDESPPAGLSLTEPSLNELQEPAVSLYEPLHTALSLTIPPRPGLSLSDIMRHLMRSLAPPPHGSQA